MCVRNYVVLLNSASRHTAPPVIAPITRVRLFEGLRVSRAENDCRLE